MLQNRKYPPYICWTADNNYFFFHRVPHNGKQVPIKGPHENGRLGSLSIYGAIDAHLEYQADPTAALVWP